jgi:hypothetical protein
MCMIYSALRSKTRAIFLFHMSFFFCLTLRKSLRIWNSFIKCIICEEKLIIFHTYHTQHELHTIILHRCLLWCFKLNYTWEINMVYTVAWFNLPRWILPVIFLIILIFLCQNLVKGIIMMFKTFNTILILYHQLWSMIAILKNFLLITSGDHNLCAYMRK